MTYGNVLFLLKIRKVDLAKLFNSSESYIASQPLDKKLSKAHKIIVEKQLEINQLEQLLQQKGYGIARACDDCQVKFDIIRIREDGDDNMVCDDCYKKYIKKGDKLLIDGSWFDDNQNRGYVVREENNKTFILHQGERLNVSDIPLSKMTVFEKLEFDDSEAGLFID